MMKYPRYIELKHLSKRLDGFQLAESENLDWLQNSERKLRRAQFWSGRGHLLLVVAALAMVLSGLSLELASTTAGRSLPLMAGGMMVSMAAVIVHNNSKGSVLNHLARFQLYLEESRGDFVHSDSLLASLFGLQKEDSTLSPEALDDLIGLANWWQGEPRQLIAAIDAAKKHNPEVPVELVEGVANKAQRRLRQKREEYTRSIASIDTMLHGLDWSITPRKE